jgi:two-component system chemotaxis response regulator CheB
MRLTDDSEVHSCRPSVDVLFESIAGELGRQTIAGLLTGMGRDGARGLLAIRMAGGVTFAQDEESSVVFGMPREAIALGAAVHVLPLGDMARFLVAQAEMSGLVR